MARTHNKTKSKKAIVLKSFVSMEIFWFPWCPGADLNHRHEDFQSTALPLSYPGKEKQHALGPIVLGRQAATVQRDFW